jgi:transcriptional regulator with XRE-family HTH domain
MPKGEPRNHASCRRITVGEMSATQLTAWRERRGWTKQQAADALGIQLRSIYQLEKGDRPISRTIQLLTDAYHKGYRGLPFSRSGNRSKSGA